MGAGTNRRVSVAKEVGGWGSFFTTIKTTAAGAATSLVINGAGGATYGVAPAATGQKVWFLEDLTEAGKLISNVTGSPDATLTIPALTNSQAAAKKIVLGAVPTIPLLLDGFGAKKNVNPWSSNAYTGNRVKNTRRRLGRIEVDGTMELMLRPGANAIAIARAFGTDNGVTGTPVGGGGSSTSSANTAVGISPATVTVVSATNFAVNDIIQFGTGNTAECRKISSIATNVLTVDVPWEFTHTNGEAVVEVQAPFVHKPDTTTGDLLSLAIEDYVPFDDDTQSSGLTTYAYYMPGAKINKFKFDANSEQGIKGSLGYVAQDKVTIPASSPLALPSEELFAFDQEAVLLDGTASYQVEEISIEGASDALKRYTKKGDRRPYKLKCGQRETTASFKFYETAAVQQQFWGKWDSNTPLALIWTITDSSTGYYYKFTIPRLKIDLMDDGNFNPGDLVDLNLDGTAELDAGATNTDILLEIGNGYYLRY